MKWLELFETKTGQVTGKLADKIFNIDEEGALNRAITKDQGERKLKKALINFFVDYFYMKEKIHLIDFMESFERTLLIKILTRFNGNQRNTAEFLGLSYTTLNQKIKKYNIQFRKTATSS